MCVCVSDSGNGVGLLRRKGQWVHTPGVFFLVVPVGWGGGGGQRKEKSLIVIPFLLLTFSCAKFSGSNVLIP